jgi:hypothetical protein
MRSGAVPLLGWGTALIAIALFGALAFGLQALPTLLLAGAGTACATTGAAAGVAERRRARCRSRPELLLHSSAATLVLSVGTALIFVGLVVVGPAVLWPGVWLVVAGAGGLVRELRAGRRLQHGAGARGSAR